MAEQRSSMQDEGGEAPVTSFYERAGGLLLSYQERLLAWQREMANIVAAETSFHQAGMMAFMQAALPLLARREAQWQRMVGLTATWWRLAADMQAALVHAFSLSPPVPAPMQPELPGIERRSKSVVINFPDRRRA